MSEDENRILTSALGSVGAAHGGRRGAEFAAKRLRTDEHEINVDLQEPLDAAAHRVTSILAPLGNILENVAARHPSTGEDLRVIRALVGGGVGGMNPVLVTVTLTARPHATTVLVRGVAKEGLIKQRAGQKTAQRIAALLQGSPA